MTIKIFSLQICINAHPKIRFETESLIIGSLLRLFSNTKKEHWKISIPRLARIKNTILTPYSERRISRREFCPKILTLYPTGDPAREFDVAKRINNRACERRADSRCRTSVVTKASCLPALFLTIGFHAVARLSLREWRIGPSAAGSERGLIRSIHKSARFSAFPGRGDLARRAAPTFTLSARFIRLAARSQPAFDPARSKPGGSASLTPERISISVLFGRRWPKDLWPSSTGDACTMPNSLAAIAATVKGYRGFKNKRGILWKRNPILEIP